MEFSDTVTVKSPQKIEYIGLSKQTQNILFGLSFVKPIYISESHISRNPGTYGSISPPPASPPAVLHTVEGVLGQKPKGLFNIEMLQSVAMNNLS